MSAFGQSKGGGRRSAARSPAPLIALVSTFTETKSSYLVDISATGARLSGAELPARGDDVLVSVEGIKAFGVIVWAEDDQRGVAFEPALQPGEVLMLKHRVSQARGLAPDVKAAMDEWALGVAR